MPNTIKLKRSSAAGAIPPANSLVSGELAANTADGILYLKKDNGSVVSVNGASTLSWNDITNKPAFATVSTSGNYNDLSNKPNLAGYATTANNTFTGTQYLQTNSIDKPNLVNYTEPVATASINYFGTCFTPISSSNYIRINLTNSIGTLRFDWNESEVANRFKSVIIEIMYDSTVRSIQWNGLVSPVWATAFFQFPSGVPPTLTNINGRRDIFRFYTYDKGRNWTVLTLAQDV